MLTVCGVSFSCGWIPTFHWNVLPLSSGVKWVGSQCCGLYRKLANQIMKEGEGIEWGPSQQKWWTGIVGSIAFWPHSVHL